MRYTFILSFCFIIISFSSCVPYLSQPMAPRSASLGTITEEELNLRNLPRPAKKVTAAVYKFRDQTGQYKPSDLGANWSTAISQGTTSILLRSLEESGWFRVIERENLGNLLNERKIIVSSREQYGNGRRNDQPLIPSLLYAGIILEGGIISYDANMRTGGAGLRYFGTGGSTQYREDRVTVYLRAISSQTGEILKTVYTTRTVLSQSVDVGTFRYVKFQRLLEAETGFTYNEPAEIAVKDAIDKAVHSLVIEGILERMWGGWEEDVDVYEFPAVQEYLQEKEMNRQTDLFGRVSSPERRGLLGVSLQPGFNYYKGDLLGSRFMPNAGLEAWMNAHRRWSWGLGLNSGVIGLQSGFRKNINSADLMVKYKVYNEARYSPYFIGSGGAIYAERASELFSIKGSEGKFIGKAGAGLGFEFLLNDRLGLHVQGVFNYLMSDRLDDRKRGIFNDVYLQSGLGLQYYFRR